MVREDVPEQEHNVLAFVVLTLGEAEQQQQERSFETETLGNNFQRFPRRRNN